MAKYVVVHADSWGHAACGQAGKCAGKKANACDDGKGCTFDLCSADVGCVHKPVVCADNDPCTLDACSELTGCTHSKVICADDGDACTSDSCDSSVDAVTNANGCTYGKIVCADDGNPCTSDACDTKKGCAYSPANTGGACINKACRTSQCTAGTCKLDTNGPFFGCNASVPGTTCAALFKSRPDAKDGKYWLDWDGPFGNKPALYTCDMKNGGWTLLGTDTFETGTEGWTTGLAHAKLERISKCGQLTSFVHHDKHQWYKSYTTLPKHDAVRVVFDALAYEWITTLEGSLWIDDGKTPVWSTEFKNPPAKKHCGSYGNDEKKSGMLATAPHTKTTVKVIFGKTKGNFYFGVDNVNLWVR